ncbi:hypothetical protein GCM10029978_046770 [Actinoallomurus acanthiterrae]
MQVRIQRVESGQVQFTDEMDHGQPIDEAGDVAHELFRRHRRADRWCAVEKMPVRAHTVLHA